MKLLIQKELKSNSFYATYGRLTILLNAYFMEVYFSSSFSSHFSDWETLI